MMGAMSKLFMATNRIENLDVSLIRNLGLRCVFP